ncbi:phosphonate metabolism transcriptional regulator PhnF [Cereibacter changlensis JA139]|uniref:Phosphonate metabolism transcriptional regulator PhnF n=2 Tax=Cereibacter changlensis TaxID=402884 RepID=A0A2T4JUN9_9RHOB|nr:phosphonate metabolism transcriptional regulator PhnF [Cereibacter changlensis]PTE21631.1 phosphonate metabolism transcriptional regulator PhnF [Cereibacter changlensis JA139]PZX56129.1 GntR family phosphonate transport system transcriptional regulator [Cereibacter changlensis]
MRQENWQRIRDQLSAEITGGQLPPGAQLPTETQLAQSFRAGRHSVRRAVAALAVEGKLRVEQGRGTFVQAAPLINYHIGRRTRFRQNLLEQGVAPAGDHIARDILPAPAHVAAALRLAEAAPVHRVLRRGLADGVPINLGFSWHCAERFPDLAARRAAGHSVTEIYRDYGIADYCRKTTTVFARRPDAQEAALLMQHPDQPVIVLQKTDVDAAGHPIGYSEAVWAGDRVQFTFDSLEGGEPAQEAPDV